MSTRLEPLQSPITIDFEGKQLQAEAREPVAVTLLANDVRVFSRSVKYHRPRGPFCFSGACGQCLMRVDGVPNIATCVTGAKAGQRVERQNAFPDASIDVFAATDLVFSKWFNHHEFLAGVPLAQDVMLMVARKLSGLGTLPEKVPESREPAVSETHEVVIVGAGAAGLAAARKLTERAVPYVLFERDVVVGGRLVNAAEEGAPTPFRPPEDQLRLGANVVGLFRDADRTFLAVVEHGRLHLVFAKSILLTVGGHPTLLPFENNDLPGVLAGRAVARVIRRHRLLPGKVIACVGDATEARGLAKLVIAAGGEAVAVGMEPVEALGVRRVQAVRVVNGKQLQRVACDVIALCSGVAPSFELARAAGARVTWDASLGVFAAEADAAGRTSNAAVRLAGEVRGPMSAAAAAEQGLLAAEALVADRSAR